MGEGELYTFSAISLPLKKNQRNKTQPTTPRTPQSFDGEVAQVVVLESQLEFPGERVCVGDS